MDYNKVAHFVRVVELGGFTAAARAAGLPKSSVSRAVALLEQELGVRLLNRTTRQVALTEAGQSYYDAVSGSVASIDEAGALAREHGAAPRGSVRLTAPPDVAALPEVITALHRAYPGVRVELSLTSRYVDLVAEGYDLALRAGTLESSSLIARRIGAAELKLMASPDYLQRRGRPTSLEELPSHDWVLFRAANGRATLALRGPDGKREVTVTGRLIADDMSFCRRAAEAGAGIALLPIHALNGRAASPLLEQVLPGWTGGDGAISVVLPSARYVPARVALVRDYLVEHLGQAFAPAPRGGKGRPEGTRAKR